MKLFANHSWRNYYLQTIVRGWSVDENDHPEEFNMIYRGQEPNKNKHIN